MYVYVDDNDEVIAVPNYGKEPPPLKSEISRAMQQTNSRKAAGLDGIPVELFKAGGDATLDRLHEICTLVWETGEWPQDWTESVFVPLPKKGDLRQCKNYRTIALVSHASKIILKAILESDIRWRVKLQMNRQGLEGEGAHGISC